MKVVKEQSGRKRWRDERRRAECSEGEPDSGNPRAASSERQEQENEKTQGRLMDSMEGQMRSEIRLSAILVNVTIVEQTQRSNTSAQRPVPKKLARF